MSIFMNNKKTIIYVVIAVMLIGIFSLPAASYGATAETETPTDETATTSTKAEATADETETPPTKTATTAAKAKIKTAPIVKIRAKTLSSKTIKLRWSLSRGADRYEIQRYSPTAKKYKVIKCLKAGKARTYKDTNLKADQTYHYKVRAYKLDNKKKVYGKFSPSIERTTKQNAATRGSAVVSKAKSRVGAAYRTGGTGPRAFDCSGFVYWTYKNAGVATKKKIARTSSAGLYSALGKYKVKKAQKGDIILFTRGGRIGHAAIYTGNGKIVHASNPRTGVCNSTVRIQERSGAKVKAIIRVVKD